MHRRSDSLVPGVEGTIMSASPPTNTSRSPLVKHQLWSEPAKEQVRRNGYIWSCQFTSRTRAVIKNALYLNCSCCGFWYQLVPWILTHYPPPHPGDVIWDRRKVNRFYHYQAVCMRISNLHGISTRYISQISTWDCKIFCFKWIDTQAWK